MLLIGTHLADNQLRHHHRVQQEKPADRRVEMLCAHRARRPEDREDQRQHQHEAELHLHAPCRSSAARGAQETLRQLPEVQRRRSRTRQQRPDARQLPHDEAQHAAEQRRSSERPADLPEIPR